MLTTKDSIKKSETSEREIELPITETTCAACARRVEHTVYRKLRA